MSSLLLEIPLKAYGPGALIKNLSIIGIQGVIRVIAEGLARRARPEAKTRLRKTPVQAPIADRGQLLMLLKINSVAKGGLRALGQNATKLVPTLSDAPGN